MDAGAPFAKEARANQDGEGASGLKVQGLGVQGRCTGAIWYNTCRGLTTQSRLHLCAKCCHTDTTVQLQSAATPRIASDGSGARDAELAAAAAALAAQLQAAQQQMDEQQAKLRYAACH